MRKHKPYKLKNFYGIYDTWNDDICVFVGNSAEVCEYLGLTYKQLINMLYVNKKRKTPLRYQVVRIEENDETETT